MAGGSDPRLFADSCKEENTDAQVVNSNAKTQHKKGEHTHTQHTHWHARTYNTHTQHTLAHTIMEPVKGLRRLLLRAAGLLVCVDVPLRHQLGEVRDVGEVGKPLRKTSALAQPRHNASKGGGDHGASDEIARKQRVAPL